MGRQNRSRKEPEKFVFAEAPFEMRRPFQLWAVTASLALGLAGGCATRSAQVKPAPAAAPAQAASEDSDEARPSLDQEGPIPIEALAHFATGLLHDLNAKPDAALDEYTQAALANPKYEPLVVETARRLIRAQKPAEAVKILEKATDRRDASGASYAWLGLAAAQTGQTDLAIRANRTAIKKLPQSLPAYQNLAQLYFQTGRTNQVMKVLALAGDQSQPDVAFLADLAGLYLHYSRALKFKAEDFQKGARRVLHRAENLNSSNPAIVQKLADAYSELSQFDKAEALYQQLISRFPRMIALRTKLADVYLRKGQRERAAEQLQAIAKEDPTNPRTQAFLGALSLEANNLEEATQYFERALLLNPDLESVYYELAGLKINQRQPQEALSWLDKARARFKLNFVLEFYTGLAHVLNKRYGKAVEYFTSAEIVAKANDPNRLNHVFYFQLGSACERNGDHQQAERYFEKCLELSPEFADALNYLGYMWADLGIKLDRARVLIEKAVGLEPNNAAFLDSLGWVLFKLNQPKEALAYILLAIEKSDEPDPTLYDHLGDIYASLEEFRRAREAWEKSLRVEQNDKIRQKLEASE